jgi:hypothetical protein
MPFNLTDEAFDRLWHEAESRGEADCPDTEVESINRANLAHVGKFCERYISLQPGLEMRIAEIEVAEDLLQEDRETRGEDRTAALVFCLSGLVKTTHRGLRETIQREEPAGYWFFGVQETELWKAGHPFLRVYLHLYDPLEFFTHVDAQQ